MIAVVIDSIACPDHDDEGASVETLTFDGSSDTLVQQIVSELNASAPSHVAYHSIKRNPRSYSILVTNTGYLWSRTYNFKRVIVVDPSKTRYVSGTAATTTAGTKNHTRFLDLREMINVRYSLKPVSAHKGKPPASPRAFMQELRERLRARRQQMFGENNKSPGDQ